MPLLLDDDDTTPTENVAVLRELAATLAAFELTVVEWGAATTPGIRRRVNEDAWSRRDDLFALADGMGGRGGGALAARVAVDGLIERAAHRPDDWERTVHDVNDAVRQAGAAQGIEALGTTLLAAYVTGSLVTIVHVGDSRAYRLTHVFDEGDRLDQLTHDHDVRAELLAAGLDVRDYRDRGVAIHGLTSFVGGEPDGLRVDVVAVPVRSGDRILLCTDGVHRQLDDNQLRAALGAPTTRQAAEALIAAADQAGGRDNATAIVLQMGPIESGRRT